MSSSNKVDAAVYMVSVPDNQVAKRISHHLVEAGLAACVQVVPISSVYMWEGEVNEDNELLLLIKTRNSLQDEVESTVGSLHPYDVPEILRVGVQGGNQPYLDWIVDVTKKSEINK